MWSLWTPSLVTHWKHWNEHKSWDICCQRAAGSSPAGIRVNSTLGLFLIAPLPSPSLKMARSLVQSQVSAPTALLSPRPTELGAAFWQDPQVTQMPRHGWKALLCTTSPWSETTQACRPYSHDFTDIMAPRNTTLRTEDPSVNQAKGTRGASILWLRKKIQL